MRKLVTIRKVYGIEDIPDADLIEAVKIDGWRVVCKKGEFQVGDVGIYFEVDSHINTDDYLQFSFLNPIAKKSFDGKFRARIKSRKLRGVVSQGLFLPLSLFPDINFSDMEKDYSEELGVVKYEPPVPATLQGLAKGSFPSFLQKSDETRCQNIPWVLDNHVDAPHDLTYEVSLKLNGSSMTVFHNSNTDDIVGVCSRNLQLKLEQEGNTFIDVAKRLHIMEKLTEYYNKTGRNIAVQGELIGEGIQKNFEKIVSQDFYIYTVFDIDNQIKLLPEDRRKLVSELGLKHVPVYEKDFNLKDHFQNIDEMAAYADGPSMNTNVREGVVFKANQYIKGEHFSFKAISNRYLLKYDTDD